MNNEISATIKNVGISILKSKYFYYAIFGVIIYFFVKRQIKGIAPKVAPLPKGEDQTKATQTWWDNQGSPIMNRTFLALKNEGLFSTQKRNNAYIELLALDRAQLTYLYNQFNKQYSTTYFKGESLTKVIDSQWWYIEKASAIIERLTGWNLI